MKNFNIVSTYSGLDIIVVHKMNIIHEELFYSVRLIEAAYNGFGTILHVLI